MMQEVAADLPLLCPTSQDEENDIELQHLSEDTTERDLKKPSLLLWVLVFSAGISGLLFGYEWVEACMGNVTIPLRLIYFSVTQHRRHFGHANQHRLGSLTSTIEYVG